MILIMYRASSFRKLLHNLTHYSVQAGTVEVPLPAKGMGNRLAVQRDDLRAPLEAQLLHPEPCEDPKNRTPNSGL